MNAVVQLCLSNVYSISKLPIADRADGRQFCQPITCVLAGSIVSKKRSKATDYWTMCCGPRCHTIKFTPTSHHAMRTLTAVNQLTSQGAGQQRPVNSGKLFVCSNVTNASFQFFYTPFQQPLSNVQSSNVQYYYRVLRAICCQPVDGSLICFM